MLDEHGTGGFASRSLIRIWSRECWIPYSCLLWGSKMNATNKYVITFLYKFYTYSSNWNGSECTICVFSLHIWKLFCIILGFHKRSRKFIVLPIIATHVLQRTQTFWVWIGRIYSFSCTLDCHVPMGSEGYKDHSCGQWSHPGHGARVLQELTDKLNCCPLHWNQSLWEKELPSVS